MLFIALFQFLLQILAWIFHFCLCLAIFFEIMSWSKFKVMSQFLTFDGNCYFLAIIGDNDMGFSVLPLIKNVLQN